MKIIISENGEKALVRAMINELYNGYGDSVLKVKKYLDMHFLPFTYDKDSSTSLKAAHGVIMLSNNGQPSDRKISIDELLNRLMVAYPEIIGKSDITPVNNNDVDTIKLLKQIIIDWFNNNINERGTLTKY